MSCERPENCPAVITVQTDILRTREDYLITQRLTAETTKELQETKIALVEQTGEVKHLCQDLKSYKTDNEKEHGHFFNRLRTEENKTINEFGKVRNEMTDAVGKIKVSEATKLSTADLLKIVSTLGILFGIFFAALKYLS